MGEQAERPLEAKESLKDAARRVLKGATIGGGLLFAVGVVVVVPHMIFAPGEIPTITQTAPQRLTVVADDRRQPYTRVNWHFDLTGAADAATPARFDENYNWLYRRKAQVALTFKVDDKTEESRADILKCVVDGALVPVESWGFTINADGSTSNGRTACEGRALSQNQGNIRLTVNAEKKVEFVPKLLALAESLLGGEPKYSKAIAEFLSEKEGPKPIAVLDISIAPDGGGADVAKIEIPNPLGASLGHLEFDMEPLESPLFGKRDPAEWMADLSSKARDARSVAAEIAADLKTLGTFREAAFARDAANVLDWMGRYAYGQYVAPDQFSKEVMRLVKEKRVDEVCKRHFDLLVNRLDLSSMDAAAIVHAIHSDTAMYAAYERIKVGEKPCNSDAFAQWRKELKLRPKPVVVAQSKPPKKSITLRSVRDGIVVHCKTEPNFNRCRQAIYEGFQYALTNPDDTSRFSFLNLAVAPDISVVADSVTLLPAAGPYAPAFLHAGLAPVRNIGCWRDIDSGETRGRRFLWLAESPVGKPNFDLRVIYFYLDTALNLSKIIIRPAEELEVESAYAINEGELCRQRFLTPELRADYFGFLKESPVNTRVASLRPANQTFRFDLASNW